MPDSSQPRDLLVVFNRIGDLTLSTPLFRALARERSLSLLTRPFGRALLGEQSYIEQVYTLDTPNRGRGALGRLLLGGHRRRLGRRLAGEGFERVLLYDVERRVIREWIEEFLPGRTVQMRHDAGPDRHVSGIYRGAAESVGCDMAAYDPVPVLEIPAERRQQARARLSGLGGRLVGVQMGSQRTAATRWLPGRPNLKSLSAEQWGALIGRLIESDEADAVLLHGAPTERAMIGRFMGTLPSRLRERCHDFTDVPLALLPAVLSELTALITVDTGPSHIAAAVGCPVLTIFGPTDPAQYRPLGHGIVELLVGEAPCQFCHPTRQYKRCRDNICLNRLPADRIWEAWARLATRIGGAPVAPMATGAGGR